MCPLSYYVLRNFKMCVNIIKDQVTLNECSVIVTGTCLLIEHYEEVPC